MAAFNGTTEILQRGVRKLCLKGLRLIISDFGEFKSLQIIQWRATAAGVLAFFDHQETVVRIDICATIGSIIFEKCIHSVSCGDLQVYP